MQKNTKITFIGGGNMAGALISGLLNKGAKPSHITVADPSDAIREQFTAKKLMTLNPNDDPQAAVKQADVVVLAVKPQVMNRVVSEFADALDNQLIISVAAGLNMQSLQAMLGGYDKIVRAMPNTPAMIQMGATGLYAHSTISDEQKKLAESVLQAAGLTVWVDNEEAMHAVTAVSGSAPAYFFYVIESIIQAGENLGLSHKDATALAMQTALGSAQMAISSDEAPSELRRQVTSPNGTTQAAIESLQSSGLPQMFEQAMQACVDRSRELSSEN